MYVLCTREREREATRMCVFMACKQSHMHPHSLTYAKQIVSCRGVSTIAVSIVCDTPATFYLSSLSNLDRCSRLGSWAHPSQRGPMSLFSLLCVLALFFLPETASSESIRLTVVIARGDWYAENLLNMLSVCRLSHLVFHLISFFLVHHPHPYDYHHRYHHCHLHLY